MPITRTAAAQASSLPPQTRRTFSSRRTGWLLLLAGTAVITGAAVARLRPPPHRELPVFGELPNFQLLERSGRTVSSENFHGQVWIADFFFTNCPGPCLAMTQRLARLRQTLPTTVRFASITVDPLTDQPAVLQRYAARFGVAAGDQSWLFLTGTQEGIYRLAREGFHLAASGPAAPDFNGPDAAPLAAFLHSTRFALVDGGGRVRGIYDSTDEDDLRRLAADVRTLR